MNFNLDRNRAIYELCLAADRAQPSPSMLDINAYKDTIDIKAYIKEFEAEEKNQRGNETLKYTSEVLDRLLGRIANMNDGFPENQALGKAYFECFNLLLVSEILANLVLRKAALFAAQTAIKRAQKHFFVNIVFQAAKIIYNIHNRDDNIKEELKAVALYREYMNYYLVERDIEIERNSIFHHYNSSQSSNDRINEICQNAVDKFGQYEGVIPSFSFHTKFYLLKHIIYSNSKNHLAVYDNARRALTWFNKMPLENIPSKLVYYYILIVYAIQKKQYKIGQEYIDDIMSRVAYRSTHWYNIKENELLLNLHSGKLEEACDLFFDAYNNKAFKALSFTQQKRWMLFHAYVRLLIEAKATSYEKSMAAYSVSKFVNDLPEFSKDKRAMNIPILIAQLLFLIVRRKYEAAGDRIIALEKYTTRYLKDGDSFRSNCFIKMLLVIPKQGFNRIAVERYAQKYTDRLQKSEIELIDQPYEIEIIPYERLWDIILDNLSKKKRYKTAV